MELDDPELELRGEALYEVLDDALEQGLWNAQRFLLDIGCGGEWATSATLSFGSADATGARSANAPEDLLRFNGDERYSAIHASDGTPWGRLLEDSRHKRFVTGDWFYFADSKVWVTKNANIPDTTKLDYFERLELPADDDEDEVDFPADARSLIVAEAAFHAMHEYWVPAGDVAALEMRLARNRQNKRTEAAQALRRTTGRQTLHAPGTVGSHYFLD